LPICPQFCLHTINIVNSNCLMPNTEFQMPAPSSQCLIPNALSPSCSRTDTVLLPFRSSISTRYRSDNALFPYRSSISPHSRSDTALLPYRHCSSHSSDYGKQSAFELRAPTPVREGQILTPFTHTASTHAIDTQYITTNRHT
jgi:hypothetical protein